MRPFAIVTIHPDVVHSYLRIGALRAAIDGGLAAVTVVNLRDFAVDKHASIDDAPYGGGDGMVMRPEPLAQALHSLPTRGRVLLTSPQGKIWNQRAAERFAASDEPITWIAGRFAGVDQRFVDHYVDEEWSIGDTILAGGELPALMMLESLLRLVPGVLGHKDSAATDSFGPVFAGGLEHPLYTRPAVFEGVPVPDVLLSGDHARIAHWRHHESQRRTAERRPDLLAPGCPIKK